MQNPLQRKVGCEIRLLPLKYRKKGAVAMDNYITGATIRRLREEQGITQAELAQRIGVGSKVVSKKHPISGGVFLYFVLLFIVIRGKVQA